jgi:hypothetical protein
METNTRQVIRVPCWHHNVVVLECRETCTSSEQWAFKHDVVMFTPSALPTLTLAED